MSYTEIHFLNDDNTQSFEVGEVKNAFRGAMYVWNHIAQKYFGLKSFPSFDLDMQSKIWNAGNHKDVEEHDLFVLASTMDFATINAKEKDYAVEMMRKFHSENEGSSLGEQADLIESCNEINGSFAFCQTSVCDFWGLTFDDVSEEYIYLNVTDVKKCFCAAEQSKLEFKG